MHSGGLEPPTLGSEDLTHGFQWVAENTRRYRYFRAIRSVAAVGEKQKWDTVLGYRIGPGVRGEGMRDTSAPTVRM
jgi:hypothetical protein